MLFQQIWGTLRLVYPSPTYQLCSKDQSWIPNEDLENGFLSILLSSFYLPFRDFSHNGHWRRKSL